MIVGLGKSDIDDNGWNFVNNAYYQGYLENNVYTFQGLQGDDKYAHLTLGGYYAEDAASEIDWYDVSNMEAWELEISVLTVDGYDLLLPPESASVDLGENADSSYPSFVHFNTSYPFIGVDTEAMTIIKRDLDFYIPDISCQYNYYNNIWNACYYTQPCDASVFNGATINFQFGGDAAYEMPLSSLMIDYTNYYGSSYCAIAVQEITNMPYDESTQRHFYFGDVFFKQFMGIFDQGNNKMGIALSSLASTGSSLSCPGTSC